MVVTLARIIQVGIDSAFENLRKPLRLRGWDVKISTQMNVCKYRYVPQINCGQRKRLRQVDRSTLIPLALYSISLVFDHLQKQACRKSIGF
jgi:hypothetical protein